MRIWPQQTDRSHSDIRDARSAPAVKAIGLAFAAFGLSQPLPALAQTQPSIADLERRVEALEAQVRQAAQAEQELQALKAELAEVKGRTAKAESDASQAQSTANQAQSDVTRVAAVNPAPPDDNSLIRFQLTGSVVADFSANDAPGSHSSFGEAKFLPIFLASYGDRLLFEGHMEVSSTSDGETDTSLEYAQLDFLVNKWLTVTAGKFLTPVGQFQQSLHTPWINKLPTRPVGFVEDGGDEPLSDIGVMVRGGFPVGSMKATYAAFVGNGPRMGDAGPVLEGFGGDDNSDKAFGGRVSIFPIPHLELGLSGMHARIKGLEAVSGTVSQADYALIGGDFAFTKGYWDIRGEYIHSRLDAIASALTPDDLLPTDIPRTTWNNWYVQAAYRLAGIFDNPIVAKIEPVVRYSQLRVNGFSDFQENEEKRWSVGLDYWFAPSLVAKIAYENSNFPEDPSVNSFHAQVAFGF
ncbi:MAG: hypothetical protein CMH85_08945 [Novosphingobium sp.]|uniref:Porin n=2 Tax=Sphingomonadales TaxID=204457 RepID=A0A419R5A9_9SPHN|nr:porin [Tsuneonella suprasediminis]MAC58389.1 hypothetical protein [Novosphingobium sp.]RJX70341.1 hypothetical protein D6858_02550 [Tsuneonella suprasediminis]